MSEDDVITHLKRLEEKIDIGFAQIIDRIEAIERRRNPTGETRAQLVRTVRDFYRSYNCPCCEEVAILDDRGSPLSIAQYDHWYSKSKSRPTEMWVVCQTCNLKLESDSDFKHRSQTRFASFQVRRDQLMQPLLK
ncbi:hypothetical protein Poly51_18610 [Rubripirellula tenax]|uniref:HNH domain-containing protein n=1 Tax=Rubripirellula tenax TaxID=2528015 RepID=A0A5C6FCE4_9BACT|nr:hypothetical protein [Rubripirellula tenax]TWU59075.1 hypothetical protein Poly51_18610 [Rubripirellula tenax]